MKRTVRGSRKNRNRRTRRWRKQLGGGDKEIYEFIKKFYESQYMPFIGPLKPVVTPDSSGKDPKTGLSLPGKFVNLWLNLTPEDKIKINHIFPGFTLDAYISPEYLKRGVALKGGNIANIIIFYAKEYLDILAEAAEMTTGDVLKIIETMPPKTDKEMDIIGIAFGDDYIFGRPLSETGKTLREKYVSMLPLYQNVVIHHRELMKRKDKLIKKGYI